MPPKARYSKWRGQSGNSCNFSVFDIDTFKDGLDISTAGIIILAKGNDVEPDGDLCGTPQYESQSPIALLIMACKDLSRIVASPPPHWSRAVESGADQLHLLVNDDHNQNVAAANDLIKFHNPKCNPRMAENLYPFKSV